MTKLNSSTRLKLKRDTFFLSNPKGEVYFRNNTSSFRMEGKSINQWIEKLVPMFNGEYTLGSLTDGLPDLYRERVFEIAEILYQNEFATDISQDHPHQLPGNILKKYASQIEFLDNLGISGAYRFQSYRQTKVLAIGSGSFFVSLASALLESGLPQFQMLITDPVQTNKRRLKELIEHAKKTDPEVLIEEIFLQKEKRNGLKDAVQPFQAILYVSQGDEIEELKILHAICKEEKKIFIPAIFQQGVGLAGPLVHPENDACWESAWRRIHKTAFSKTSQEHIFSSTTESMLANVIVFELFKKVTDITKPAQTNQFFLLNSETLEGNWHSFLPHPLVTEQLEIEWVQNFNTRMKQNSTKNELNEYTLNLNYLVSKEAGIFHIWEAGDLKQLPLAQCRIQAVDPLSEGPAELLPDMICTGLTHMEARYEAGLSGVETYISRIVSSKLSEHEDFIGIGAGETIAECVSRGLQKCLDEEFRKRQLQQKISVSPLKLDVVEDERCRFYLQALTTIQGIPTIALGESIFNFPVIWICTNNRWYGSVGFNRTLALRKALQQALTETQNYNDCLTSQAIETSSVLLQDKMPLHFAICSCENMTQEQILQSAEQTLKQDGKRLYVFEVSLEAIWKEELAGIFGVLLGEEESH
ncbi:putative thiazole-containing bacteriocin maturation protein [Bacillus sp. BP-3]|uniref:putative thiazole-containing bacteriocin maturation protein n=1 Tax=Bacillus sp. BP-3 TaxID=3022773 RepID=UPI00232AFFEC|nr:putative thiazole-containing bacteriocin maturation protein [Bacillus sp. BP-3]MDC2864357.1 putative thiazole-containing bacteriocin maturation protein [Bacillus sp. BP-3]